MAGPIVFPDPGAAVPGVDSTANTYSRDVIGNKTDAAVAIVGTSATLIAYDKGILNRLPTAGTVSAVKSRGRGTVLIASGVTDGTATITAVVVANTKVWPMGWEMAATAALTGVMPPRVELTNTTTISVSRSDNGSAPTEHITVGYEYEELY